MRTHKHVFFKPKFYFIIVGFKGVKIIQACFRDGQVYPVSQTADILYIVLLFDFSLMFIFKLKLLLKSQITKV